MTNEMMVQIKSAIDVVTDGVAKRVDGDGFKVYRVHNLIRVDIDNKEN